MAENLSSNNPNMAQNAIATLTVRGLVDSATPHIDPHLERLNIPEGLVDLYPLLAKRKADPDVYQPRTFRPEGPPTHPPSSLPAPGNLALNLELGEYIGSGRSGIVFAVHTTPEAGTHRDGSLPPLVLKIARQERCQSVAREAWFYEELECLQGVVLPRCYGCFRLNLQDGQTVPAWSAHELDDSDASDDVLDVPAEYQGYSAESLDNLDQHPHPLLTELGAARDCLVVLLLECLAPEPTEWIPERSFWLTEHAEPELLAAHRELAHLGVETILDIRLDNVMFAPPSPPGLPTMPSPFTGLTHRLRIIDLDLARKCDLKFSFLSRALEGWVRRAF